MPDDWLDRPLHLHQEHALERACVEKEKHHRRNRYWEREKPRHFFFLLRTCYWKVIAKNPGVRCLLVYPMNALANDQLYFRIAPLFGCYLKESGITFGRFTGQIRANAPSVTKKSAALLNNDKLVSALGTPTKIPRNWLLTREEMLLTPPDVLITNYAMLEHILLLPRNAPLFAGNYLEAIVLG